MWVRAHCCTIVYGINTSRWLLWWFIHLSSFRFPNKLNSTFNAAFLLWWLGKLQWTDIFSNIIDTLRYWFWKSRGRVVNIFASGVLTWSDNLGFVMNILNTIIWELFEGVLLNSTITFSFSQIFRKILLYWQHTSTYVRSRVHFQYELWGTCTSFQDNLQIIDLDSLRSIVDTG